MKNIVLLGATGSIGDSCLNVIRQNKKHFHLFGIGLGGNFISATPDTDYTAESIRKTKLSVQISTKLNRSHLITGEKALILPCLGRTELDIINGKKQFVTVENSMGFVHKSEGILKPASSKLMSEINIVCNLAKFTLGNTIFNTVSLNKSPSFGISHDISSPKFLSPLNCNSINSIAKFVYLL